MSEHNHDHDAAIDPVCGMSVDPHTAKHQADYRGHPYYFCSAGCRTKFAADPQKYLGPREPEPVIEGAIYTCPMHPQIRQVGPAIAQSAVWRSSRKSPPPTPVRTLSSPT